MISLRGIFHKGQRGQSDTLQKKKWGTTEIRAPVFQNRFRPFSLCQRADLKQSWVGSKSDNVGKNWENTSFPYKSPPQAEIFEISGQNRWETL